MQTLLSGSSIQLTRTGELSELERRSTSLRGATLLQVRKESGALMSASLSSSGITLR